MTSSLDLFFAPNIYLARFAHIFQQARALDLGGATDFAGQYAGEQPAKFCRARGGLCPSARECRLTPF